VGCPDENALLEYADGVMAPERASEVAEHLVSCATCRAVLAGVAKASTEVAVKGATAAKPVAPPAQLLRDYLATDASRRENVACNVILITEVLTLVTTFIGWSTPTTPRALAPFMALLMCWTIPAKIAIRRGRYHPAISWINALLETTVTGAITIAIALNRTAEDALRGPTWMVWCLMLTMGALRARPVLSLVSGAVAAVEALAVYLWLYPSILDTSSELSPRVQMLRSALLFLSGFAAAGIAAVMIRSGERALKAVREQDLMGKYVLHELLGKGGMAEVYRATYCPEGGFQKTVAVKRVLPQLSADARFVSMFLEEARLCATLVHPNIVQVHDCGRFRDAFILAMEFVDGAPLSKVIAGRTLPLCAITYAGAELARALDYVHNRRASDGKPLHLVHRDLNPPNVLVSRLGEVKLADFGVAFSGAAADQPKGFAGKLRYASPEQLAMQPLDARSDLFLLGLTLQEMLGGGDRKPLEAGVPAPLRLLVGRLLDERRERRPSSAAEVHAELSQLTGELAPYPAGASVLAEAVGGTAEIRLSDPTHLESTLDLRRKLA
jgi:serine/threonine-protein kinase